MAGGRPVADTANTRGYNFFLSPFFRVFYYEPFLRVVYYEPFLSEFSFYITFIAHDTL